MVENAVFDCLVLGDSIAHGVAMQVPQCISMVKDGISSRGWSKRFVLPENLPKNVVISLGSNDREGEAPETYRQLSSLRAKLGNASVSWILPPSRRSASRAAVVEVAIQNGDKTLSIQGDLLGPDAIHPTRSGYSLLARRALEMDSKAVFNLF